MTDTMMKRMQALEAVALAVEEWTIASPSEPHALERYAKVLSALDGWRRVRDALPASPGEMVEVRAYVRPSNDGGAYIVSGMGALNGRWIEPAPGSAYAILTARVPLPTVPTIVAEVRT